MKYQDQILIEEIQKRLKDMEYDFERFNFLCAITNDFCCEHCGSLHLPCYCWNDD